ncbi:MAG: KH domain-containing protein, partial [Clostridia bacterium]|nr:KH domain-containing protein [Clostridia bacterium]
ETLLISELKSLAEKDVEVVPVSARKGKNIKELLSVLESKLVYDGKIFEEEIVSDRSEKFMISEIMREKILLKFDKEIPHGVAIVINEFTLKGKTYHVNLDIVCEKQNHKAILIGKNGTAIKQVSTMAREEMEKFLGRKVFLTVFVKVKENWRNSASLMNEYGYKEE